MSVAAALRKLMAAGLSQEQVLAAVEAFESEGLFKLQESAGNSAGTDNGRLAKIRANDRERKRRAKADSESSSTGNSTGTGGAASPSPVPPRDINSTPQSPPSPDPEKPPAGEKSGRKRRAKTNSKPAYSPEFEAFWQSYPPHNGHKKPAFEAWQEILPDEWPHIMAALPKFRDEEARQMTRFVNHTTKHPQGWLRARAWERLIERPAASPAAPNAEKGTFVAHDTPQWVAWVDFTKRTKGRAPPTKDFAGKGLGWYFPSEWPPMPPGEKAQRIDDAMAMS